jgi:hypothetical protein
MNLVKIFKKKMHIVGKSKEVWEKEIEKIENFTGYDLPLWYKNFLRLDLTDKDFEVYYDKSIDDDYSEYVNILDVNSILTELSEKEDVALELILKNKLIPFSSDNGGGDYFYLQVLKSEEKVVRLFHDTLFEYELVSTNIEEFLTRMMVL